MYGAIKEHLNKEIESIKEAGLFKEERIITSPQGAEITLNTGQKVLNFCANNYLGLSNHPEVIQAAVAAGAHIWNDVRALTRPNALETAAKLNIPVIIMHVRGEPTTMNGLDQYDNVTLDVMTELSQRVSDALKAGVKAENIYYFSNYTNLFIT